MIRHPELPIFLLLVILVNFPLLGGSACWALMFEPQAVRVGEWWRVLTHPFVHVTWYHLLLDSSAFFVLYASLLEPALWRRLAYVAAAAGGSLLFSWLGPSSALGLCGLSGIAHGLMAVSALEMIAGSGAGSPERRVGLVSLGFLLAKAGFEALTGRMLFAFLDFGMLGHPIVVSHAGGILGALLMWILIRLPYAKALVFRPTAARSTRNVLASGAFTFGVEPAKTKPSWRVRFQNSNG